MDIRKLTCGFALLAALLVVSLTHNVVLASVTFLGVEFIMAPRQAVCGVNTLGTLATATIVQEALDLVFTIRPLLNNISKGFTDKNGSPIAAYNQAVITRTLGLPTIQNFGSAASARADTDVSVTLNNFKEVAYVFTPTEYSGTNRDLVREAAMPLATAFANSMVDVIAGIWTIGNFPTRAGADAIANGATVSKTIKAAGWDYTHLTDVRGTLNKAGVPQSNRFYAGNSDVYGSMLTDLRIVGAINNPDNASAIKLGKLPDVAGFGLAEYPALPTTGNLVGFAGTADSTVYAARVPRDPRELLPGLPVPGNMGYVTEPRTGLTVMVLEYLTMSDLSVTCKLVWMYGAAVGNANNGQLITKL